MENINKTKREKTAYEIQKEYYVTERLYNAKDIVRNFKNLFKLKKKIKY